MTQYSKASAFGGGGSASVITTRGDIIRGDSSGADERLAIGAPGEVLTSDGTDAAWAPPTVGDVVGPASAADNAIARYDSTTGKLIQNSSATIDDSGNLTANNVTGTNTGDQTFDGLSPMTTGGDIIYGGASGTGTRLANGTSGQVLTSAGGTAAPSWATPGPGLAVEFYTHATLPATLVIGTRYVVDISGGNGAATMPTISGANDGEVIEVIAINIPASGTVVLTAPSGNFNDVDLGTDTTFEVNVSHARFILNNGATTYEVQDDYWALGAGTNTPVPEAKAADFTASDNIVYLVSSAAARAITLPAAASGTRFWIKDSTGSAGTNNFTITRAGSESIEGVAANKVLSANWGSWVLMSDGTNWFIL